MIINAFKNTAITFILILTSLIIGSSNAFAQQPAPGEKPPVFYEIIGEIETLNETQIKLSDQQIMVSPTVKIFQKDLTQTDFSQLRVGNKVGINTITINRRQLVDSIYLLGDSIQ